MKKTVDKRTRKRKLIRNLVLIVLLPALLWFLMGMCPLSAKGAFRRAMRENFVTGVEPQVVIDTSDPYFNGREYIVLGEKDNVVYQAAVRRNYGPFWMYSDIIAETLDVREYCIVPLLFGLRTQGTGAAVSFAVRAEGADSPTGYATLRVEVKGVSREVESFRKQDGWFLFAFPTSEVMETSGTAFNDFMLLYGYYLDTADRNRYTQYDGTISFRSFDQDPDGGPVRLVQQGFREL